MPELPAASIQELAAALGGAVPRPRELYPPVRVRRKGRLQVSPLHSLYWEESGNPGGRPLLYLHGGPGGGTHSGHRRFFDPAAYRIVLFDQRGCGRSTPRGCVDENTTWYSVDDVERLREMLGVERWVLFGGSWGSALALAYAQRFPERVSAMVLYGIFLLRPSEIRWFYQDGASHVFPEAWEEFVRPIPHAERHDLVAAFHRRLTGSDPAVVAEAARAWSVWEGSTSRLYPDLEWIGRFAEEEFAVPYARVECHYMAHGGFFQPDQLLDGVDHIRGVPAVLVQGRYDMVCPAVTAWELHRRWPEAELRVVPGAGHSALEPAMVDALVRATDGVHGA
ncbi:MAG: prolyl aminopeptidase [Longimicrobiaceae bacterium]